MNDRFFALPEERRRALVDAGLAVFARNDYRHASMADIAARAGVSKALLFHYFESKRGLYLYLYEYAMGFLVGRLSELLYAQGDTDFFDLLARGQQLKLDILREHPDLMQFVVASYYEESDDVAPQVTGSFNDLLARSSEAFLGRFDTAKFKDTVTAEQALHIVMWMSDGFMRAQAPEKLADLDALNDEFMGYLDVLRRHFYKEEYL